MVRKLVVAVCLTMGLATAARAESALLALLPADLLGVEWLQNPEKTTSLSGERDADSPWVEWAQSEYALGPFWIAPAVLRSDRGTDEMLARLVGWEERVTASGKVREVVRLAPEPVAGCVEMVGFSGVRVEAYSEYDMAYIGCVTEDGLAVAVEAGRGTLGENVRMAEAAVRAVLGE